MSPWTLYQSGLSIPCEPVSETLLPAVGDASIDADPYSGDHLDSTSPTTGPTNWYEFGGTSLATPMWAATVTAANTTRAGSGKANLSAPHATLDPPVSTSNFYDIAAGSNGTCARFFRWPLMTLRPASYACRKLLSVVEWLLLICASNL